MRAFKMHAALRVVYFDTGTCFAQAGLSVNAIRDAARAASQLLSMSSKNHKVLNDDWTLAVCLLPVKLPCRLVAKRPVGLGRVPPDITPWSGGRAGEPRALCCDFRVKSPRGEAQTTPLGF